MIAYFVSLRKWLWNYEGLITLFWIMKVWLPSFEWIALPWLPICQGKDSGLSPRYVPPWCMTMQGSDHAPPPSWTECLTALSNKLHSRQLAEISWKGEFKSKGDKLCSSAEGRIWTRGPRHIHTYIFVVVNFDALAQASDIQIERRQVVFLCWMQDLNPGSQTPNRQQTECSLTNRLSYRGSS